MRGDVFEFMYICIREKIIPSQRVEWYCQHQPDRPISCRTEKKKSKLSPDDLLIQCETLFPFFFFFLVGQRKASLRA